MESRKFKPPLGKWEVRMFQGMYCVIGRYGNFADADRAADDLNRVTPRLSLPDSTVIHPESNESQKP